MKRIFETERFIDDDVPKWPCPSCEHGVLSLLDDKFEYHNDALSTNNCAAPDFGLEEYGFVFCATLECNTCHEIVIASGTGGAEHEHEESHGGNGFFHYYKPTFFQPPLKIIDFPSSSNFSADLRRLLTQSFTLFWCDYNACANKIRSALELLLDALMVPRYAGDTGKAAMSLHQRIEYFPAAPGTEEEDIKTMIMAMKWMGNTGSHELAGIKRDELIDGFKMLERCLRKAYPTIDREGQELLVRAKARIAAHARPKTLRKI